MLRPLARDLWVAEQPLRFAGVELGARMTVVRLPGERLLLHSPIARSPELAAEVERLGAPALVVAPNKLHHLYVQQWLAAYPASRLFVAPGLETKRPGLKVSGVLGAGPPAEWRDVLVSDLAVTPLAPSAIDRSASHRRRAACC